ncbi:hypothetical protein EJB05_28476, partial [Eragrostis curvula]
MSGNKMTPYVIAIIMELIYTGAYVISKAALDKGINAFVFTFYRQAAASLLLLPVALVFERKNVPSLSPWLLLKLFFCALVGITCSINLLNVSLTFTSATVTTATTNSVPVFTFCFALLFRMEVLKLRSPLGIAKLAGIGLCLTGVFILAFYTGPELNPVNHHHAFTHTSTPLNSPSRVTWIKGTFLMVLTSMTWSLWMIMQAGVLKEYPNKMIVTVTQSVFSVVQCFLVAVVAERDFSLWKLRIDISLLAIIYGAFMVAGVTYYLQVWCMELKGPVFVAMWQPLLFVFTIFCSSFFLGENVYLGSIIAGALLVSGLYSVLWGKSKEPTIVPHSDVNMTDVIQGEMGDHHIPQATEKTTLASAAEQV